MQNLEEIEHTEIEEGDKNNLFHVIKENFDLEGAIEALAFATPEPLTPKSVAEILQAQGLSYKSAEIEDAFHELLLVWQKEDKPFARGIRLVRVGGGITFRTDAQFSPFLRSMVEEKPQKLSQSQLEVLSIVAYRQPITKLEIEEIRGVDCANALKKLLNLKLVKIIGKSETMGRPMLYGTHPYFLEYFGMNSLHELPTLKEYQELSREEKEEEELIRDDEHVTIKDFFDPENQMAMFSEETLHQSQEALSKLDEALNNMVSTAKRVKSETGLDGENEEEIEEVRSEEP